MNAPSPLLAFFVSTNPSMRRAIALARRAAATDVPILLVGETGTGKRLLSQAIHGLGTRAAAPVVPVLCAGLDATMPSLDRLGRAFATGGTVLLEEVGDATPTAQKLLLGALDGREPGTAGRPIATTTHDLDAAVRDGSFRADLLAHVGAVTIALPPLRERREDLADLTALMLSRLAIRHRRGPMHLAPEVFRFIAAHDWPGNLRELEHALERWVVLAPDNRITRELLDEPAMAPPPRPATGRRHATASIKDLERVQIERTLAVSKTLREAARRLGIDTSTLWRKRQRLGLA